VQNPVGLSVPDRAQHDCLRFDWCGHAYERRRCRDFEATLFEAMAMVTVYTTESCSKCVGAKALLAKRGIDYKEINLARDPDGRAELMARTGMFTFPQILIEGETIGGFEDLIAADRQGRLKHLQAAA
jgi:glutaredoxin 3